MHISAHLQVASGIVAIGSIATVLLLTAVARQLLHGRLRAAVRTTVAAGLLAIIAFSAAVPLGLTPVGSLFPSG